MTGSLRVKNGIWQMVFSYKDDTGKWRTKSESTKLKEKGNKRKAQAMLDDRLRELGCSSVQMLENEKLLFLPAMQDWLDNVMVSQVRYNTLVQYKNAFAYNIKTHIPFQGLRLQKLTPALLQGFYNEKIKTGLSASSVHKLHANINKFLTYAFLMDMIPVNPAQRVILPRKERPHVGKAYTLQQMQALFDLFKGDPLELVVFLTAVYGLRRSEVCGLRWSSVDFDNRQIYINHTAIVINSEIIRSDRTKTATSYRTLPMNDQVYMRLKQAQEDEKSLALDMGDSYPNSGYVCLRWDGEPFNPDFVTHHFARKIRNSSLPYIRFHDLRHTVATLLHNGGFDLKDIQGYLGHSDIATTGNIYSHLEIGRFDKMVQSIEISLFK